MGKCMDLSEFDVGDWVKVSPKCQVLWVVPCLLWSISIKSGLISMMKQRQGNSS